MTPADRGRRPGPRRPREGNPRGRQATEGLGGEQVEGRRAVVELLRANRRRVHDVWMAEGTDPAPVLDEIAELAQSRRVPLRAVIRSRLAAEARTDAPQGVLAHADPLPEADLDDLCRGAKGEGPRPFLLAVDGVTDPRNLGALLRSAEAAGATGAILPRHRAARVSPATAKAAAGAIEWLPLAPVAGMASGLARARELGCWIVGLAGEADQSLFELTLAAEPLVLVVGAEGGGLSHLVGQRCDMVLSIPMRGSLGSLNASAAGALGLFEVARRRAAPNG